MSRQNKDFKVAIVGGGMCGLLCAIGLIKAGIHVEVFEAAAKFEEVGAGVSLGPNAVHALDGLGVLEAILSRVDESSPTKRPFRFISGAGEHEHVYNYTAPPSDYGLGIYRPDFLEALIPLIDPSLVHFDRRCVDISATASGSHILHFATGDTYETDLVIGADGIKSVTRNFVGKDTFKLVYSNTVAYRSLLPTDSLKLAGVKTDLTTRPLCWVGRNRHIITFPVQMNQIINIVAFATNASVPIGSVEIPSPWVQPVSEQELIEEYSGWGDDAMIILKSIKKPSKWYIHSLDPPLSSYSHQKVVLVGDAAHAMLPHLGAGAGQGFEDVYVLCRLLGDARTMAANLDAVLRAYDTVRVPRANMVLKRSFTMGNIYEGYGENGENGHTIPEMQKRLAGMWEPVWHHNLDEEIKTALTDIHGSPN